jgi:hypothetical protein
MPDYHAGVILMLKMLMSHKSAKETISCRDSSNLVGGIYVYDAIQYWIMVKRYIFTVLLLAKRQIITR